MSKRSSHHESQDQQTDGPRWKRVHHSWIFWVGVVLTLVAIISYVLTLDLATHPGVPLQQPTPGHAIGTH